jgi:hypothetical protein
MGSLQAYLTAARAGGFVEVNDSAGGSVMWLRKEAEGTARETYQRMCMDSLTDSVTVYWTTAPGKVSSKTFRHVSALQEWMQLKRETIMQR